MIYNFTKGFNNDRSLTLHHRATIAISANIMDENSALHFAYSQAIVEAGGVPIIIPANCDSNTIHSLMMNVDGVLLSGGDDIDAQYFDEENIPNLTSLNALRDHYEFMLLRAAIDRNIPILGICRGCQVINVALGGNIYQDLPTMYKGELLPHSILTNKHLPVHEIEVVEGSRLHQITSITTLNVNSRHHQAIKDVAPTLRVSARSKDGVIEGIEGDDTSKIIALQCHPENLATKGKSSTMKSLFADFVGETELYHRAKYIHISSPIVDSHCDTPMLYNEGLNFALRNHNTQVDIAKMNEGFLDCAITVAYIPHKTPISEATSMALSILDRVREDISNLEDIASIAYSTEDILMAKSSQRKSIMLGIENGLAIGHDISNIDLFKERGVAYITLCHNGSNDICDSAVGDTPHNGVSEFGREVIVRMNQLGITVDISHSSHKSTLDAIELSTQPIIASHSSCKALCDHPRNLTDDLIKKIANMGGVVQVCGYGGFLCTEGEATIFDLVDHIEHIISLTGYDHVGIGSDFDGGGGIKGFEGANHFLNITIELLRRDHLPHNIAKIMGGNILRVLSHNQK